MKRLLVIALVPLERHFRLQKIIGTLTKEYSVTVAAFSSPPRDDVEFVPLSRHTPKSILPYLFHTMSGRRPNLRFKIASYLPSLSGLDRPDVVLCYDVSTLPLGVKLKRDWGCGLILDAAEYAPALVRNPKKQARLLAMCRECMPELDGAVTVSNGLIRLYREEFGLECKLLPNVPRLREAPPVKAAPKEPFQMICHGIGARGRGLMKLVELAPLVAPKWHLNLMLVPPSSRGGREHYDAIMQRAGELDCVTIREPVDPALVVDEISQYDAGVYLMPGDTPNKVNALPNKFFDFMQAGLAVFLGPEMLEMKDFVNEYGCGAVSSEHTPESMAELLLAQDAESLVNYQQKARLAASKWCHEEVEQVLLDETAKAFSGRSE